MGDELRQLLKDVLMLGLGGFSAFIIQHWRSPETRRIDDADRQAEIIAKQGKTLSDAFDEIDELRESHCKAMEEIEWLKAELKKYVNGYARAMRFIHDKIRDVEIPNFLETDPRLKPPTK